MPPSWEDVAAFVLGFFAARLWKLVDESASVTIEYCYGHTYMVKLAYYPPVSQRVAGAIREIYKGWAVTG